MVRENPLWQQDNTYPARLDRQFIEDVFDTEGVIRTTVPGALAVSQRAAGANMSVDVAAGRAVIKGDDEANQGSYRVISTAVENLPIGAAPGSNSRIDLVVARVRDANVTGGVSSDWILEVIPGVVAASPVAPAVPNTAIPLAQVLVAAGTASITTAMITDRRATAQSAAYVAKALADAKGDLFAASAADTVARVAVGANGTVLTADSTAAAGVAWAAAAGGLTKIAAVTLGSNGAIQFSAIPATYHSLLLVVSGRVSSAVQAEDAYLRINSDTGANYGRHSIAATGGAVSGASSDSSHVVIGKFPGASAAASRVGVATIEIPTYASTTRGKVVLASGGAQDDSAKYVSQWMGFWNSLVAITALEVNGLAGNFVTGSTAVLYGRQA